MIEVVNNNVSSVVGGCTRVLAKYESIFNRYMPQHAKNFSKLKIYQTVWMKRVSDRFCRGRGYLMLYVCRLNIEFNFRWYTKIDLLQQT